jgi:TRAP-type C4-dicarboxylate transport system substrate-binding protein
VTRKGSFFLAALLVLCLAIPAAAKTMLTALTVWNNVNYQTRGLQMMAKRVAELTKGEVDCAWNSAVPSVTRVPSF